MLIYLFTDAKLRIFGLSQTFNRSFLSVLTFKLVFFRTFALVLELQKRKEQC